MSSAPEPPFLWTAAGLHARYGSLPLDRLHIKPDGATAAADDVVEFDATGRGLFELDRGLLIRKPVDTLASAFRERLTALLSSAVRARGQGTLLGPQGAFRAESHRVLLPDISYYAAFSGEGETAGVGFAGVAPDLVVEIIRPGNTGEEMELKLQEYFSAGVRLVWYAYPRIEEIHAYANLERVSIHTTAHVLSAEEILPGFALPLAELFPAAGG